MAWDKRLNTGRIHHRKGKPVRNVELLGLAISINKKIPRPHTCAFCKQPIGSEDAIDYERTFGAPAAYHEGGCKMAAREAFFASHVR